MQSFLRFLGGINLTRFEYTLNLLGCLLFHNLLEEVLVLNLRYVVFYSTVVEEALVLRSVLAMEAVVVLDFLLFLLECLPKFLLITDPLLQSLSLTLVIHQS